jgi:transposase-like protein
MEYGGEDVMAEERMAGVEALYKLLETAAPDVLREILTEAVTKLMALEVDGLCGAGYGERSADRVNARNGYRPRPWDTRLGTIDLALPKLRQGTYFPGWLLEPRRRAERALVAVVAESYVLGVSTRKVEDLVQTLGIARLSKSQVSELAKSLDGLVASSASGRWTAGRTRTCGSTPWRCGAARAGAPCTWQRSSRWASTRRGSGRCSGSRS